jgi:hypothetical protein
MTGTQDPSPDPRKGDGSSELKRRKSSFRHNGRTNWMPWQLAAALGLTIVALLAVFLGRHLSISWDKKEGNVKFDVGEAAERVVAITKAADAKKETMNAPAPAERIDEQFIVDQLKNGIAKLPTAKIVWVDDEPNNNQPERLALAILGIYCDSYSSTMQAKQAIEWNAAMKHQPYNLIISDYGRDVGPTDSGAITYQMVRSEPGYSATPFVFYTADHIQDAAPIVARDSNAALTNVRDVLLRRVLQALSKE